MTLTKEERLQRKRDGGRKGGLAKVPKGVAKMTPERRREISRKGALAANKVKAEKKRLALQNEN